MRLLFVSSGLVPSARSVYTMKWRSGMKLLLVSKLDRFARAVSTITKYVQVGKALGHEVAVFGEQSSEEPNVPYSLDVRGFDFVVFVVYDARDFPDLPYLAQLLDGVPKGRRIIIDCCGRYNETIRVEHDFNHLERLDGHQGWEWVEAFQAVSDKVLQPTLSPLRSDVRSFLFHAFDPAAVVRPYSSARAASQAWSDEGGSRKPYGVIYVGNNWQRWAQIAHFLQTIEPLKHQLGPGCIVGWDWDKRPDWAVEHGLRGVDVDSALLDRVGVETRGAISFDEVADFIGQGRFCPIFHRPLFNYLGLVTNRTFETFYADTIPLLMLPDGLVEAIYGTDARPLAPGSD
ncbi:MAG TPA: hypothetical protein VKP69_17115, partial [Isosphaeraceae bacterium]|nr:hypothetical protein [Isosphaeraceae bacterium]